MTSPVIEVPMQPYAGGLLVIDLLIVPDLNDELKMAGGLKYNFTRMSRPTFFDIDYIGKTLHECCVVADITAEIKEVLIHGLLAALETYIKYMLEAIIDLCKHRSGNDLYNDPRYVVDNDVRSTMMFLNDRAAGELDGSDDEYYGDARSGMRDRGNIDCSEIRLESTNNTALMALGARKALTAGVDQTADEAKPAEEREAPQRPFKLQIKHVVVKDVLKFMEGDKRYKKSKLLYDAYLTYSF